MYAEAMPVILLRFRRQFPWLGVVLHRRSLLPLPVF